MTFDFETFPELVTDRLILRRITKDDLTAWLDVWQDEVVLRYLIDFEEMPDEAEVRSIIQWTEAIYKSKAGCRWAITLKPDHTMIGSCGFHLYDATHQWAEIGYELHHDFWRKGMMSEAVSAVVKFCFEEMDMHRVEANVTVGNQASAKLLESLGFTLEGTWRDKVYWQGAFHSLWQYGILRDEFNELV